MRRFIVGLAVGIIAAAAPMLALADDQQIAQQIAQKLGREKQVGKLHDFSIDLQVDDGTVWLTGSVPSSEQQHLVLEIARNISGVRQVVNDLTVAQPAATSQSPVTPVSFASVKQPVPTPVATELRQPSSLRTSADDQQIAEAIAQKIGDQKKAGNLRDFSLDLQVDRGTVWLKGNVASAEQQFLILEIARRIDGVRQVVNDLSVTTAKAASAPVAVSRPVEDFQPVAVHQSALQAESPAALQSQSNSRHESTASVVPAPVVAAAFVSEAAKAVQPNYGDETEPPAMPVAELDETASPPVAQPNSVVKSRPATHQQAERTSDEIAQDVVRKLTYEKQLGNLRGVNIDVQVEDGAVMIDGVAATAEQQTLILESARRVAGVKKVVNGIRVASDEALAGTFASTQGRSAEGSGLAAQRVNYANGANGHEPGLMRQTPVAFAPSYGMNGMTQVAQGGAAPIPAYMPAGGNMTPARYDHPQMPAYAWPSYASHPNYAAVTYPKQYSPMAWPYIGPFYPYPQVPMGWRKVTLEWDDGWWMLDFKDRRK
jgi:osmotically-inducible protein OsmY